MVQNLVKTKKVIKVGKISGKYYILSVEERKISLIVNNTERSLEMTPLKGELMTRRLNVPKIRIKKQIEKNLLSDIV